MLAEIGGTVGDIESLPFLEAIRQLRQDVGRENTLYIHLTLVPYIGAAGELKTKPTQHSVRDLRAIGIQPDILICRTDRILDAGHQAQDRAVLRRRRGSRDHRARTSSSIYEVPLGARRRRARPHRAQAAAPAGRPKRGWTRGASWSTGSATRTTRSRSTSSASTSATRTRTRASTRRSTTAASSTGCKVNIRWVEAEALEQPGGEQLLDGADGILVPGGFGDRGTRGMMRAAEIARERGIPYFGICYGFQWAAVEYARNVCGLADADSTECAPDTPTKVIYKLRDLLGVDDLGGTMRLGTYACQLKPGSLAHALYGERRHPRAAPPPLRVQLPLRAGARPTRGCEIVGRSLDGKFVEIVELPAHPWFVAVQFHPEFKSKPLQAASAVRRLRRGELPAQDRAPRHAAPRRPW